MHENLIKSELSYAYLHAVAAKAGYSVQKQIVDIYGFDATITGADSTTVLRTFHINVQLKSKNVDIPDGTTHVEIDLDERTYNLLRLPSGTPSILVYLILPRDSNNWLSHNSDQLVSRKCAYWLSLAGMGPTPNTSNVRLRIPITNVFSPAQLQGIMINAAMQRPLT